MMIHDLTWFCMNITDCNERSSCLFKCHVKTKCNLEISTSYIWGEIRKLPGPDKPASWKVLMHDVHL